MTTWIFQANPDRFDIDGHLATWPLNFKWLVTRYSNEIAIGDQVFLWRNSGSAKNTAAIVAEATVVGPVLDQDESAEAIQFWHDPSAISPATRVQLRLNRVANKKEELKQDWMKADFALKDLPNIKLANGTNYKVSPEHAKRLNALWINTGRDWSRNESLAGLWAYVNTLGKEVSKLQGSPVAHVADTIGRTITGVYNKVMNFRAIDPTDHRKGFSSSSGADQKVWEEFFDLATQELDRNAIDAEFSRVWFPSMEIPVSESVLAQSVEKAAEKLARIALTDLMEKYANGQDSNVPDTIQITSQAFVRRPLVVAIARKRANYGCEISGCSTQAFERDDGILYCEVHHITSLADGGKDAIENVACLCANHHRELHYGKHRVALANQLHLKRSIEILPNGNNLIVATI